MRAAEPLYRWGWGTVLIGLPLSNPLMSVGLMLFAGAVAVDRWQGGAFHLRALSAGARAAVGGVLALGSLQLLSLGWSDDVQAGLQVLRNEGPLFGFALLAAIGRWDRVWAARWVPLLLGGAVLGACAAMWGYGLWREAHGEFLRPRDWSPFISHVRFSLLVAWTGGWWTLLAFRRLLPAAAAAVFTLIGGLTVARTGSVTGVLLIPIAVGAACAFEGHKRLVRLLLGGALAGAIVGSVAVAWALRAQYPDAQALESTTRRGGMYRHETHKTLRENGAFVWTYVCESELDSAWLARTGRPLAGPDARGQDLRTTAIRHMTSLGLRKDADGVDALPAAAIAHIEAGIPTVSELDHRGMRRRWEVLSFEWANRRDGGDPSGNSVLQRLEFGRAAVHLIRSHPWSGVGIGDVNPAMQQAYAEVKSPLDEEFRLRPHNQYATVWAAAGLPALLVWLAALAGLWWIPGTWRSAARVFALVLALSCLTEDTLESQAGATFAGVFIGLFSGAHAAGRPPAPRPPRAPLQEQAP